MAKLQETTLYLQVVFISHMRSDCPLNFGLELFGDKWSLLIIRDLMFFGKRHYNELLSSSEGISTNILADRLTMLEEAAIIRCTQDDTHRQKKLYSLTQKGADLLPLIIDIGLWSDKYAKNLNTGRAYIFGKSRSRQATITRWRNRIRKEHEL